MKELTKTDSSKNRKEEYNIPDQHNQPLINHKNNTEPVHHYDNNCLLKNSTIFNRTSQTLHGTVTISQACQIQKHARKQVQIIKRSKENGVKSIRSLGPGLSISLQAYKRQFRRDWYHKIIDFNQCCVVHEAHGETTWKVDEEGVWFRFSYRLKVSQAFYQTWESWCTSTTRHVWFLFPNGT